jgi:NAD(P)-dependent dehydrogenase (short-subunit alcohol dehydrogenase family)
MASVVVTGASRGIGRDLCKRFAAEGWSVVAAMREPLRPIPDCRSLVLDVTDPESVQAAAAAFGDGPLDVLVNNAAIFPGEGKEGFADLPPEWFDEAFSCNVTGVVRVTQAFLPCLRKSSSPRIVNISSGAGSITEKEDAAYYPYGVSKAALNMLTRTLANELTAMIVVALSPGWVRTEMGGPHAPLSTDESAASLVRTIGLLKTSQSGCFLGRDGEPYAW